MAVKERKQITGTTAQIQAYKGHEGQIVWDKEKKTFVGMSGTAGKNYPLAPQAYVDNEVSKVNAEVTEGLAGKEDKGVCLPLTGGKLTGSLIVRGSAFGSSVAGVHTDDQNAELMLSAGNVDWQKSGGALALYGKTHEYKGGFGLIGVGEDGTAHTLSAFPSDWKLRWDDKVVEVVNVRDWGSYIRYESGLQIVFGWLSIALGGSRINFELPFANEHVRILVSPFNQGHIVTAQVATPTYTQIAALLPQGGYTASNAHYLAIGMWR